MCRATWNGQAIGRIYRCKDLPSLHSRRGSVQTTRPRQTRMHGMQTASREDYAKQATSNGTPALSTPSGLVSDMANIFLKSNNLQRVLMAALSSTGTNQPTENQVWDRLTEEHAAGVLDVLLDL